MLLDSNTFSARYEVLRGNAVYKEIYPMYDNVEIANAESSALKMSLRGTFYEYDNDINFLTDRLRVIVTLNGIDYPLGIFLVTTETIVQSTGISGVEIEAYSILYLAQRKKIEDVLYIPSGTNYITEIIQLLSSCGITDVEADPTEFTFATSRSDWDIGTPVLDIVNQLLSEITYNSIWVNLKGIVQLTKYQQPEIGDVQHVYSAGEYSIIGSDYKITSDRFDKANVFRVTCENPELDSMMVAISENNSADSPFSTVNIGRMLYVEQVDSIPSQTALQNYADKLKYQSMQTTEITEFVTAIMPEHETFDVIALENGKMRGIYTEVEWSLIVGAGENMKHKARRITIYD